MPATFRSCGTLIALVAAGIAGCGSAAEPKPATEPPVELLAGDVVTGSVLPGDTARFALAFSTGHLQVRLRALGGTAADTLEAKVILSSGATLLTVRSAGTDTALSVSRSGWYFYGGLPWIIEVRRISGANGSFALQVVKAGEAPEVAPERPPLNTVVQEDIDVKDDVDVFRFDGKGGDEIILFARGTNATKFRVFTSDPDSLLIDYDVISGAGEPEVDLSRIEQSSSGRLWLPRDGTYVVAVTAQSERASRYAFKIMKVASAPEEGAASIELGAVVSGEISPTGDADEFTLTASAGQEVNLAVQLESGFVTGPLTVELRRGAEVVRTVTASQPAASIDEVGSGRFTLAADGAYTIRVTGSPDAPLGPATGAYKLELYSISREVENAATVAVDAIPAASTIERPGDVDEFTLSGTAGALAVLDFNATVSSPDGTGLQAQLIAADGTLVATASSGFRYSLRAALPSDGTYTLRVQATQPQGLAQGPYTIEVYTVSAAPETVASLVQIGDTISGEKIDRPGDLDEFTFAGEAGRDVNIFIGSTVTGGAVFGVVNPPGNWFPAPGPELDSHSLGRFTLQAISYRITVDPHFAVGPEGHGATGDYSVVVFAIDRAPEMRSSTYVIGDTISSEMLYPVGDVDEFTFTVASATDFDLFWDDNAGVRADILDGSGIVVWTSATRVNASYVPEVSLPAGQYKLSVFDRNAIPGVDPFTPKLPTQSFRFALTPR